MKLDLIEFEAYHSMNAELIGALVTIKALNKKYFRQELTNIDKAEYYFSKAVILNHFARDELDATVEEGTRRRARRYEEIAIGYMVK